MVIIIYDGVEHLKILNDWLILYLQTNIQNSYSTMKMSS